jgi:hypothetical protein
MKKLLAILALLMVTGGAHAGQDQLVDTDQHSLPSHKVLQWSDTLDVVVDPKNGNVCYVARQSDSHSLQLSCLPMRK